MLDGGRRARRPPLPEADLDGEGYPATAQAWADGNGCTGEPIDEDLTDTVIERTWDCPPDGATEFLIVEGGGHSWPGSAFSQKIAEARRPHRHEHRRQRADLGVLRALPAPRAS